MVDRSEVKAVNHPNVLWIMCDELRTSALSCYGTRFGSVVTPNIDRLADRGVRFTNMFATSPICVPMRTSLMTAAYPEETGVYGNEGGWRSYPYDRDLPTFPEVMAETGYETANFGKTHLPATMHPWGVDDHDGAEVRRFFERVERRSDDEVALPGLPNVAVAGSYPDPDVFPGDRVTGNAVSWLDERTESGRTVPFLLRVSYLQPHTPVEPPPPYAGLYRDLPWGDPRRPRSAPSQFERRVGEVLGVSELSTADMHQAQADYHALVAWVDGQVGILLDHLERCGLLDDIVVVFSADHGVSLGEGGLMLKHTFAPDSQRIPFIMCGPQIPVGAVHTEVCESLDLAHTLCAVTGVAAAPTFRGRDLFGSTPAGAAIGTIGYGEADSLHTPNAGNGTWGDGGGWPRRSCIRTDRYRFDMTTRRNGRAVDREDEDPFLADVIADPSELINRSGDPSLADVETELRRRLLEHVSGAYEPPYVPARRAEDLGTH